VIDGAKHAWKRRLLDAHASFDNLDTHTVRMNLALAPLLGVAPRAEVVVAWSDADARAVDAALAAAGVTGPYAVLHTFPKFNYKMWHEAGWVECARWIAARGLRVVLTGGPDAAEREYVARIAVSLPAAVDLAGDLTLAQTACLLARAKLYVGPDTAVTHMAAAAGTPTVALFGPSNPVKWGPWPRGHAADRNPWDRVGSGERGNVALVQGTGECVPCLLEGCGRHVASFSDCLAQLAPARVTATAARLLDHPSGVAA
jgi:heptosyltransferase-3